MVEILEYLMVIASILVISVPLMMVLHAGIKLCREDSEKQLVTQEVKHKVAQEEIKPELAQDQMIDLDALMALHKEICTDHAAPGRWPVSFVAIDPNTGGHDRWSHEPGVFIMTPTSLRNHIIKIMLSDTYIPHQPRIELLPPIAESEKAS